MKLFVRQRIEKDYEQDKKPFEEAHNEYVENSIPQDR